MLLFGGEFMLTCESIIPHSIRECKGFPCFFVYFREHLDGICKPAVSITKAADVRRQDCNGTKCDNLGKDCHGWLSRGRMQGYQFEMLCLEGASVGLSWATILRKRETYRAALHDFDIDACAAMTDEDLETVLLNSGIIRNRSKVFSMRKNAMAVKAIQAEWGSFDAYLWSFPEGKTIDGHWNTNADIPTVSKVSEAMSKDMKKRGMSFVGPTITYSYLQSIGIVNDHLDDCECR